MDGVYVLMIIFFLHWIGDFVFQTRKMVDSKSSSIKWLTLHVLLYVMAFMPMALGIGFSTTYLFFIFWLFITHWITDFFTSKLTSYYWKKQKIKLFFTVIGFDQLVHALTLLSLYKIFVEPYVFI